MSRVDDHEPGPAGDQSRGPASAAPSAQRPLSGAEAVLVPGEHLGRPVLWKRRQVKPYRHAQLDARLRSARTRDEAHLLAAARAAGVPVPMVYDVDRSGAAIALEHVHGPSLRDALARDGDAAAKARLRHLGRLTGKLHAANLTHGDLTTSNVLVPDPSDLSSLVLIDFGLGAVTPDAEPRGVDLHLVEEALEATDARSHELFAAFVAGYNETGAAFAKAAQDRLADIRERGRYR